LLYTLYSINQYYYGSKTTARSTKALTEGLPKGNSSDDDGMTRTETTLYILAVATATRKAWLPMADSLNECTTNILGGSLNGA